jgi:diguanylate cyclase (GGDEF)-like protein
MLDRSRPLIIAALLLVAVTPVARAAGPVPVQTPDLPATPSAPTVSVTPGDGGAGVDVGAGGAGVHLGAGNGGLTVGVSPPGSKTSGTPTSGGGTNGDGGQRVGTPAFRSPVKGSAPSTGFGEGDLSVGGAAGASGSGGGAGRSGEGGVKRASGAGVRLARLDPGAESAKQESSKQPPLFELVDRIPAAFRAALVALALIALAVWAAWVRTRRRLGSNAYVDPATGIANAAAFERILDAELDRAKRYKRPLGLLLLDVSEAGEAGEAGAAGRGRRPALRDQSLREASATLGERMREGDKSARLGPSRFAVVSPEATAASVETLGRAVSRRLEELRIRAVVGVAERLPGDRTGADLLARAEGELREAHAGADGGVVKAGQGAGKAEAAKRRSALRAA